MRRRNQITPVGRAVLTLVLLIFSLSGGLLWKQGIEGIGEAGAAVNWRTVPGKITRSELLSSTRQGDPSPRGSGSRKRWYEAAVEYEFVVDGTTYQGTRITAVKDMIAKQSRAEATLRKYPVGQAVTVSYSPADPAVCVLEPGNWGGAIVVLLLGTVFLLVPAYPLYLIWTRHPPRV